MKFSKVLSAQNHLLKAHIVSVETDISQGLHAFSIVGLPDKAVEEAKDRVSSAIKNSGFKSPKQSNAKIIVSLAPADVKKEGPIFDVPIALGYLLATEEIEFDPMDKLFVGELALDGSIRAVRGTLSYARLAKELGIREIYVPCDNVREASLIHDIDIYGVTNLQELISHINHKQKERKLIAKTAPLDLSSLPKQQKNHATLDDVIGQKTAKRGLVIAAAGLHNIALYGPPGTGKTMLARALQSILPPLSFDEVLEVTEIHSVAGTLQHDLLLEPPVRSPHHTSSYVSLVGGGTTPKPGEVTLAHRGILFLDEFPEFDKKVIESLRQPLEDRIVSISRAKGSASFPAHFILVAALNPCPCGNKGIRGKECICSPRDLKRYERKLSGPIMDRIDMWIEVSQVDHEKLLKRNNSVDETERARTQVLSARLMQYDRFKKFAIHATSNSTIHARDIGKATLISPEAETILNQAAKIHDLSGRGYHRTVKLARTIADIEGSETIQAPHILEALQYRQKHFTNN